MITVIGIISVLFALLLWMYIFSQLLKRINVLQRENRELKRLLGEYVLQEVAERLKNAKDYKIQ